jgi:excisionase family DNA binding protein
VHAIRHEPSVMSAEEAFEHLGVDRTTGYRAIKEGRFPVPVIRVGRIIRIPIEPLMQLLNGTAPNAESSTPAP